MDIDLQIISGYKLTFGYLENAGANVFGLEPITEEFCLTCSSKSKEAAEGRRRVTMGQIWSYYKAKLVPYLGGFKVDFQVMESKDLRCKTCSTNQASASSSGVQLEVLKTL